MYVLYVPYVPHQPHSTAQYRPAFSCMSLRGRERESAASKPVFHPSTKQVRKGLSEVTRATPDVPGGHAAGDEPVVPVVWKLQHARKQADKQPDTRGWLWAVRKEKRKR